MLNLYCVSELFLAVDILVLTILVVLAAVVDFVGLTFSVEVNSTEPIGLLEAVRSTEAVEAIEVNRLTNVVWPAEKVV